MAFDKDKFIKELKEMTVLELNELVKTIEEEFGVSAAAPVAAVAVADESEAEDKNVSVVLTDAGASKLPVIKVIRAINPDLNIKEAKAIADNGGAIKEDVSTEEAKEIAAKLEEAGASIELK